MMKMENGKRLYFQPQNVGIVTKIQVIFRLNISEKGSFSKVENTGGLHIHMEWGYQGVGCRTRRTSLFLPHVLGVPTSQILTNQGPLPLLPLAGGTGGETGPRLG